LQPLAYEQRRRVDDGGTHIRGVYWLFLFPISLLVSFDSRLGIWAFIGPDLLVNQDIFIFLIYITRLCLTYFLKKNNK